MGNLWDMVEVKFNIQKKLDREGNGISFLE